MNETPLTLDCEGRELAAILHPAADASERPASLGVLVVVGGPQYRVGSHRQFVHLARALAARGVPVMRFDATGMGDSAGPKKAFDQLDADIRAALDAFMQQQPRLEGVVLWGLCDGASAGLIYAPRDSRVRGLVLVNPWLENAQARARTYLWNYYLKRLFSRDFWRKLRQGGVDIAGARGELGAALKQASGGHEPAAEGADKPGNASPREGSSAGRNSYQERMLAAFGQIRVPLCWILSGNDLTAAEFERHYRASRPWRRSARRVKAQWVRFGDADHTFSRRAWKEALAEATLNFVRDTHP